MIAGQKKILLVDTGAQISLLREPVQGHEVRWSNLKARGVTGRALRIRGEQEVECQIKGRKVSHRFTVADIEMAYDGILGLDLMKKVDIEIHARSNTVLVRGVMAEAVKRQTGKKCHRGKPSPSESEPLQKPQQEYTVRAVARSIIPKYAEAIIAGELAMMDGKVVMVEPEIQPQKGLRTGRGVGRVEKGMVNVRVVNLTGEPIVVDRRQTLGRAVEADVWDGEETVIGVVGLHQSKEKVDQRNWDAELGHLSPNDRSTIEEVLERYGMLFDPPDERGCTLGVEHSIETAGASPVAKRPYPVPFHQRPIVKQHIQEMLDNGVIQPSSSPWSAPIVLVRKKSYHGETKFRFCTDFRGLNAVTKVDVYPLPLINETLEQLGRSRYFTTLDLASGYHQISVAEKDREKTAFTTEGGHYEYRRMAFGLAGAPATFQKLMDCLLSRLKGVECYVYLDDVIVYSATIEEQARRLGNVFSKLQEANLKVNREKCRFVRKEVAYLGHVVSEHGVRTDPTKIEAVRAYPRPRSVREVRSFLGLAGYYRRFVAGFAGIAQPMTELTKKNATFRWTTEAEEAFNELKEHLVSDRILVYPDFHDPFILATDASSMALGAVLSQVRDGEERPICYASRQLRGPEKNYSATELELLAVIWATRQFRCYLLGREFKLVTDHSALRWMLSLKEPSSRLMRWTLRLQEFNYEVEHKAGRRHTNADALSRAVRGVQVKTPGFNESELQIAQRDDPWCQDLAQQSGSGGKDARGVLYWKNGSDSMGDWKLAVPTVLRGAILQQCHEAKWAGHPGIERTTSVVQQGYYWPTLGPDVREYVARCDSCQRRKSPPGLKAPLEAPFFPTRPFEQISMDIVGPLPRSGRGYKYLLTMIDNFTRYAEAIPLKEITADETARALVEAIVTRHGAPDRLLTDQGRNFVSSLLKNTCRLLGTQKIQTTPYHPEGNGMVERLHRTLAESVAHYVRRDGRDWDQWVPYALMAYRAIPHSSTGYSPNYLLYGREVQMPVGFNIMPLDGETPAEEFVERLQERLSQAYEEASKRMELAWTRRTRQWNKGRKPRELEVGECVFLHVPITKLGHCKKFHRPWTGPYEVIRKISPVTYELQLGSGRKVVVHINRLKPAIGDRPTELGREEEESGDESDWEEHEHRDENESEEECPPHWNEDSEDEMEEVKDDNQEESQADGAYSTVRREPPVTERRTPEKLSTPRGIVDHVTPHWMRNDPSSPEDTQETTWARTEDDPGTPEDPRDTSWAPEEDDSLFTPRSPILLRPRK